MQTCLDYEEGIEELMNRPRRNSSRKYSESYNVKDTANREEYWVNVR